MWRPLSRDEFEKMYDEERSNLSGEVRRAFSLFRVPLIDATIRRSKTAGDERVFVVAKSPEGALYFDDVEWGYNFSPLGTDGRIVKPGASQMDLADSVRTWLLPLAKPPRARPVQSSK